METRRYETLDALRGVAAVAVVAYHLSSLRLEPDFVPHGYLAVDFFFVLSGFVVAYAYEGPLRTALSLRAFVVKRLIRLYPLALLGAAMGFVVLLLKWWLFPDKVDPLPRIVLSGVFNGLLLPMFFGGTASRHEIFPGNGPLWTLFFEFIANVLWATIGIRMRSSALLVVAAVSWLALAGFAIHAHTLNVGFEIRTFSAGLARVCFGFPVGVVIYRMRDSLRVPDFCWGPLRWGPLMLSVVLIAVLASPLNADQTGVPWWDLASVSILLPMLVVVGIGQGEAGRIGVFLGMLSYPIYVLHFPILLVVSGLHQTILARWNVHLVVAGSLVVILALVIAAVRLYDEPVRRLLLRVALRHELLRPRYVRPTQPDFAAPDV